MISVPFVWAAWVDQAFDTVIVGFHGSGTGSPFDSPAV